MKLAQLLFVTEVCTLDFSVSASFQNVSLKPQFRLEKVKKAQKRHSTSRADKHVASLIIDRNGTMNKESHKLEHSNTAKQEQLLRIALKIKAKRDDR